MFCRQCGTQNADGAPTCISCGAPLLANPYQATSATGNMGATSLQGKPKNYLVESIVLTLCCCLPLGIVSIIFAAQVDSKWNAGDQAGALASSENAKKFALIGLVLGLVINGLWIGINVLAVVGAAQNGQQF